MTFLETFETLPRPTAEGRYTVEKSTLRHRVGRSFEGFPAVLISFERSSREASPRRLANLAYHPPSNVELVSGTETPRTERLAVLECRSTDRELVAYFFRVLSPALLEDSTEEGFEAALDAIATLFRSLQRPAQSSVQGLWGELAIIAWSSKPVTALSSWHTSPRALHDFAAGPFRLEVKAAAARVREHTFRLAQLAVVEPGSTVVASLLLDESSDGKSVFDLVEFIKTRVSNNELARRLEAIVADCLGIGWREALDLRFDLELAHQRMRLYAAQRIPSVPEPLPVEVKDVSFTVDLSTTVFLEPAEARSLGPFFDDLLPAG